MKLTSILLAGAAVLTIAACGDDDDPEPQPLASGATGATGEAGATGTMAAFIATADEM